LSLCTIIGPESHLEHATPSQIQSVRATRGHLAMLSVVRLFRNWMRWAGDADPRTARLLLSHKTQFNVIEQDALNRHRRRVQGVY